jgi:hypothetical protein
MRQQLPRVPKDRIGVIIGAKGETSRAIHKAAGCKEFIIDSETGDVDVVWGDAGSYDPVKAMKLPDVVKAIGRGMAQRQPSVCLMTTISSNWWTFVIMSGSVPTNNAVFGLESSGVKENPQID